MAAKFTPHCFSGESESYPELRCDLVHPTSWTNEMLLLHLDPWCPVSFKFNEHAVTLSTPGRQIIRYEFLAILHPTYTAVYSKFADAWDRHEQHCKCNKRSELAIRVLYGKRRDINCSTTTVVDVTKDPFEKINAPVPHTHNAKTIVLHSNTPTHTRIKSANKRPPRLSSDYVSRTPE